MKKNYRIKIQYDGTRYNGWQRQENTKNTIEKRFEDILLKMCGKKTEVFASGRTDAGVHALAQVANFKCETDKTCPEIMEYLNRYLPKDIAVIHIEEVDERFHSRLNAVSKTYEYRLAVNRADVFERKYVFAIDKQPDLCKMREAAQLLLGKHDFRGFSSVGRRKKSTVRTVNSIDIEQNNNVISIKINADGFLYNMMRIISGTLLEVGLGKKEKSVVANVLNSQNREIAGITLPPCGLRLVEVYY